MPDYPRAMKVADFNVAAVQTPIVKLDTRNTKWLSIQVQNKDSTQLLNVLLYLSAREDNTAQLISSAPSAWNQLINIPAGETWCADYAPGGVRLVEVVAQASGAGLVAAIAINNKEQDA